MTDFKNKDPYPTEDEQRVLTYVGMNPLAAPDEIVEKLNVSPEYFEEMMERMAFVGLMVPTEEMNLNREHFKKLTLQDYHIFRTVLVFKDLEKKGVITIDFNVLYGARSLIFERAEKMGYRKETSQEFVDYSLWLISQGVIKQTGSYEEYIHAMKELKVFG